MQSKAFVRTLALLAVLALALPVLAEAPRIGLVYAAAKYTQLEQGEEDPQRLYRQAIEENGGAAVVLSQTFSQDRISAELTTLDGVLLPGGIDVDPKHYGESRHENIEKTDARLDELEFAVLRRADAHELPVLGVCRGHQVLNVYYGGTLIQDIPSEYKSETPVRHRYPKYSASRREHVVTLEPESRIRDLLGTDQLVVNTYHHQAVKHLATGFRVTARSADGIVEAIERDGSRFVLGVQFHPEKLRATDPRFNVPFQKLVEEARKTRARSLDSAKNARKD